MSGAVADAAAQRFRASLSTTGPLGRTVHVWRFATDRASGEIDQLQACLSEQERQHAQRFLRDSDRARFICRRAFLRILIAEYERRDPERLEFTTNRFGKPALAQGTDGLQFNASHSGGVALVAVAMGRAVGVDIERHRTDFDYVALADRFFSPDEAAGLRRTAEVARGDLFFTLWTCKEAFVKGTGLGLSFPLHRCRLHVAAGGPKLLEDPERPGEREHWSLHRLDVGRGFSAALAASPDLTVKNLTLPAG